MKELIDYKISEKKIRQIEKETEEIENCNDLLFHQTLGLYNRPCEIKSMRDVLNAKALLLQKRMTGKDLARLRILHQGDFEFSNFKKDYFKLIAKVCDEKLKIFEEKFGTEYLEYLAKRYFGSPFHIPVSRNSIFTPSPLGFIPALRNDQTEQYYFEMMPSCNVFTKKILQEATNKIREAKGLRHTEERWKSETKLYYHIKTALASTHKVIFHASPQWLEKLEIDIYIPKLMLGIEYNGKQHYQPISYFGGEEGLRNIQKRDKLKQKLCRENNVCLRVIKYTEKINESLVKDILKNYISLDKLDFSRSIEDEKEKTKQHSCLNEEILKATQWKNNLLYSKQNSIFWKKATIITTKTKEVKITLLKIIQGFQIPKQTPIKPPFKNLSIKVKIDTLSDSILPIYFPSFVIVSPENNRVYLQTKKHFQEFLEKKKTWTGWLVFSVIQDEPFLQLVIGHENENAGTWFQLPFRNPMAKKGGNIKLQEIPDILEKDFVKEIKGFFEL